MKAGHTHTERTNKAWNRLNNRLHEEQLIPPQPPSGQTSTYPARVALATAVIAIIASGIILLLPTGKQHGLLSITNKEKEAFAVTTLADGSLVYMASEATISLPETFASHQREISLSGDAFFEVTPDTEKPFKVKSRGFTITVLGTSFMINTESSGDTGLAVQSGKVKVKLNKTGKEITLSAGDAVSITDHSFRKKEILEEQFSPHTSKLHFKDQRLSDVLRVMDRRYPDTKLLSADGCAERILTATFHRESPLSVAQMICTALNLSYTNEEGTIIIHE
jgi:ferric-dicitrate binding protein FerR (iron transport regulator)